MGIASLVVTFRLTQSVAHSVTQPHASSMNMSLKEYTNWIWKKIIIIFKNFVFGTQCPPCPPCLGTTCPTFVAVALICHWIRKKSKKYFCLYYFHLLGSINYLSYISFPFHELFSLFKIGHSVTVSPQILKITITILLLHFPAWSKHV